MPDDPTLEQRAVEAIKTLPLPWQNATIEENYRRFLAWLYRGSTRESVAGLVIDLGFGVPTDGEAREFEASADLDEARRRQAMWDEVDWP